MPATYAHWHFGRLCIDKMPKNIQKIIHDNRDIYNYAVHGPDIFFYNLFNSKISKFGFNMHKLPSEDFFLNFKNVYSAYDNKDEIMAYMLGFLTHFTLDSMCHSYIERKLEVSQIHHNLIEAQWDRHLMILDNRKPNLVDRAESLKPTKKIAKTIAYFFPLKDKDVYISIKMQRYVIKLLNCINERKERIIKNFAIKKGLIAYSNLFVGFKEEKKCKDSNLRLDKLENKALRLYPKLLKNLLNYIEDKEKLLPYFNNTFGPNKNYKKIPVLSYQKELNYKV